MGKTIKDLIKMPIDELLFMPMKEFARILDEAQEPLEVKRLKNIIGELYSRVKKLEDENQM